MPTKLSKILFIAVLTTYSASSSAAELYGRTVDLIRGEVRAVVSSQSSGDSASGAIAWAPKLEINDDFAAAGLLSFAPQKESGGGTFLESELQFQGIWNISKEHSLTVSAGAQYWSCNGCDTALVVGAGYTTSAFVNDFMKTFLDEYFVRYQTADHKIYTQQIILGFAKKF